MAHDESNPDTPLVKVLREVSVELSGISGDIAELRSDLRVTLQPAVIARVVALERALLARIDAVEKLLAGMANFDVQDHDKLHTALGTSLGLLQQMAGRQQGRPEPEPQTQETTVEEDVTTFLREMFTKPTRRKALGSLLWAATGGVMTWLYQHMPWLTP